MADSYAAVMSLINLLEDAQLYHSRQPECFSVEQQRQLSTLRQKVIFLEHYLESSHQSCTKGVEDLECRIADTSYEARNLIEMHIVDNVHYRGSGGKDKPLVSANLFSQGLHEVIDEMDFIEKEVRETKEKVTTQEDQECKISTPTGSSRPPSTRNDTFVDHTGKLKNLMDKITGYKPTRQVISITGMGGIGKTTIARKVYDSPNIKRHFDICSWVVVSQEFDLRKILFHLVRDTNVPSDAGDENLEVDKLGEILYRHLLGRRYFIVLDDMWCSEAWYAVKRFLPDQNQRSRVLVTSRLLDVSKTFDSSNHIAISLLDANESWDLLHKMVFGKETCPVELEELGKRIASNCKGLPLSIVVIGGLLAKSKMMQKHWQEISRNTSQIVNSANDESCLALLSLSYDYLPAHLKPCFLYMGVYFEAEEIHVTGLVKLWIAEGFIKPIVCKSLEEVSESYLKDLIDRNLILPARQCRGWLKTGYIVHDLLRDLCLREAKKCRFLSFIGQQGRITRDMSSHRRVAVRDINRVFLPQISSHVLQSALFLHSIVEIPRNADVYHRRSITNGSELPLLQLKYFKLLRVFDVIGRCFPPQVIFRSFNSRYLRFQPPSTRGSVIPCLDLFWNLQSLTIGSIDSPTNLVVPSVMWEMPQFRHIEIWRFEMPDPPSPVGAQNFIVQRNLQTLLQVNEFKCTEEILKGRPNLKRLEIRVLRSCFSDYSLNNLECLLNLESFNCQFGLLHTRNEVLKGINFPQSLRKLTLFRCPLKWDDLGNTIGVLPKLEILRLCHSCNGEEWNPQYGQFVSLKVLLIGEKDPCRWNAQSSHFPCLEHLMLVGCNRLREIPPGFGEIDTLESILLDRATASVMASAKKIVESQNMAGNEDFLVTIRSYVIDESHEEHGSDKEDDSKATLLYSVGGTSFKIRQRKSDEEHDGSKEQWRHKQSIKYGPFFI